MHLTEKHGYDDTQIARQLQLVGLGESDHELVAGLHQEVIAPHARTAVGRYYRRLMADSQLRELMSPAASVRQLHQAQLTAVETLGRDFDTQGYFETRLRIGALHACARVPLQLYLAGLGGIARELAHRVPPTSPHAAGYSTLILKLMMLDVALVAGSYHLADMERMQRLLRRSRTEARRERDRARRDSLTDAFNRQHVEQILAERVEAARRSGRPLAVAMVDIDHFKPINDEHGHPVGDEVLRQAVARMRRSLRENDTLGRYGGDEFLLLLHGVTPPRAREISERLRERVGTEPIQVGDRLCRLTVSVGLAGLEEGDDAASLLRRADEALYRAKRGGRDRVCFDTRDPQANADTLDQIPARRA